MSDSTRVIRARWVVPVTSPPIENGYVGTSGSYITQVGKGRPDVAGETIDLGDSVLLPGLVNAHTHLALTSLHGHIPYQGSFTGWIKALGRASAVLEDDETFRASVNAGLQASLSAGVTTIADIGYGQRSIDGWRDAPLRLVGFLEVLGMGPKRWGGHERSISAAEDAIRRAVGEGHPAMLGLSPHAPYSTDPVVYRDAMRTSCRLCTHLAETREEHQFLHDGTGPFRDLLEEWNLWDGSFQPPGCSPVQYMQQLGLFRTHPFFAPLLVHVNYLDDADLDVLAATHANVVYCPRAHAFFGHEPHRYREMLGRGINVCIGTDSLASNDSLSILDELRFLRSVDDQSSDEWLLRMGTMHGAAALGPCATTGALECGGRADLVAVPLGRAAAEDPLEDLLRGNRVPSHVFSGGRLMTRTHA